MVAFLLVQVLFGSLILWLRQRLSAANLLWFAIGSSLGTIGSFFLMAVLAMMHPITSDPGMSSLNLMRYSFVGLVFAFGQLGGLLAVNLRIKWFLNRLSNTAEPGLSPSDDR